MLLFPKTSVYSDIIADVCGEGYQEPFTLTMATGAARCTSGDSTKRAKLDVATSPVGIGEICR